MKSISIIVTAILCTGILFISSCGGDGDPDPGTNQNKQEEVTALLVGKTWKVQSVSVDGVDRSSMFTGMTIAFTNTGFTVTNAGPVWPATGTWTYTDAEANFIKRSDNLEVQVAATASTLTLTLTWTRTTLGPGKAESVAGKHVFVLGL